jgi:cytochrome c oxidase subunit 2
LVLPLLVLSGCGDNPQSALEPAGEYARKIHGLWDLGFGIAVAVFVVVEGLLLLLLIRFRARPGNELPKQVHGNTRLEIGWTILPALLLAVLAVPTVATIFDLADVPSGDDVLEIRVTGHQWWWEVDYLDNNAEVDFSTANEIHIPVGTTVAFDLESFDVIHSFWVPRLAGKLDVVPGHTNRLAMKADEAGVYSGQCAEFCGLSHANMRLRVVADDPDDYEAWAAGQRRPAATPESGLAARGHQLFAEKGCIGCHTLVGYEGAEARVGPNLTHIQSRSTFAGAIFELTPANLKRWLADPPAMKPMQPEEIGPRSNPQRPIGMPNLGLSPDEIEALVAYLETLE